ncbi:RNA polymerase ECF family sigma subunit [Nonomuraea fuscirosea]|uniref:RNA polymerase ECF family sigma subunit n=1 Tax=Nonomuraea fuscirosea TaxID=1291556 RepID=A0A2T0LPS5_9ACTN|nr:sigma-70 family RNA polymerase sigma factor [Nonomuraea fuscirosea]PRX45329.1 RNA polymerase ECF family sigma subunit [Nonomuraea fuscirosea]
MGSTPHGRFVQIYEHAYRPVLGYVLRRCQDPDDAADVVAETFAIAWQRVNEIPAGDEARFWLYGVARKALANHRRGERRHERRAAALREQIITSPALTKPPPGEYTQLGRVFRSLNDDDRELLSLVAWEKLDTEQLAHTLGITRNAVRVRLHRARKRFMRALTDAGIDLPLFERSTL